MHRAHPESHAMLAVAWRLGTSGNQVATAMLTSAGLTVSLAIVFTAIVGLAAGWDIKQRRIPNGLALATVLLGTSFALVSRGVTDGAWAALGGAAVGLAVWLPWWWLGMMGAGDVKFFAAAAAWLGPRGALSAALVTALLGGVLAIGWLIARKLVRRIAGGARTVPGAEVVDERRSTVTLPYGVAMALGLGVAAWIPLIR